MQKKKIQNRGKYKREIVLRKKKNQNKTTYSPLKNTQHPPVTESRDPRPIELEWCSDIMKMISGVGRGGGG